MTRRLLAIAALLTAGSALAQAPLQDIQFQWSSGKQQQQGFQRQTVPEIDRYDTLSISVDRTKFLTDAGIQLGTSTATASDLETELRVLAAFLKQVGAYHSALVNTVAAVMKQNAENPSAPKSLVDAMGSDPQLATAREGLRSGLADLKKLKAIDPQTYAAIEQTFGNSSAYVAAARTIEDRLNQLSAKLQSNASAAGALGITATIVPPDAAARSLHLPNYDSNPVASAPAIPNYIPVVDSRTQNELNAAEDFLQVGQSLTQISSQLQQSVKDMQSALQSLRTSLKTDVLEAGLNSLIQEVESSARTDLGDVLVSAKAARDLVHTLNSSTLTLDGATDAQKLLNLANTMSSTAQALTDSIKTLPAGLNRLAGDIDTAVKKAADTAMSQTETMVKQAATDFLSKQTFFIDLANNLKSLGQLLDADSRLALSADRIATAARALDTSTDFNTTLDLRTIQGDVHVRDNIVVQAGFYRRDSAGTMTPLSTASQTFVIQRYSIFPDSVRGGLIFAQPRSAIQRNISYQPVPAMGYYWRYGSQGHPTWNAIGPSFGFTMALLDFKDGEELELGFAGGISVLRDLAWVGYGRNLQAHANYFYVGTNPLLLVRLIQNGGWR